MNDELHVYPTRDGARWLVEGASASHLTATEAERAARRRAVACGARRICVHDRYHRVRAVSVTEQASQGAAASGMLQLPRVIGVARTPASSGSRIPVASNTAITAA